MPSLNQGQVYCLMALNKLVDMENRRENQNGFNFTACGAG
jgi:hypothetical protein